MIPQAPRRSPGNSSRVNLLISAVFHGVIIAALAYFAAREGLLGKELKKIAVELVREKPPEPPKPREPEKPRDPAPEPEKPPEPTPETPRPVASPPPDTTAAPTAPPPPSTPAAPSAIAPPAAALPAFTFGGGRAVESSSDPVQVYRGLLEYALRSQWNRPTDVADTRLVAEVEIAVDRSGRIGEPAWKRGSGHERWDASVRDAIARTPTLTRPPPTNFPPGS